MWVLTRYGVILSVLGFCSNFCSRLLIDYEQLLEYYKNGTKFVCDKTNIY